MRKLPTLLLSLSFAGVALAQTNEGPLNPADPGLGDGFGGSSAVDGNTIVVGANLDGGGEGSAYVFRRAAGGVWSQEAKLSPAGAGPAEQVGHSVDVAGDLSVLGAPMPFDPFVPSGDGAVYVYERSGTSWSLDDTIAASDGQIDDQFGHAVAVTTRILVGARGDESAGVGNRFAGRGAAYVFRLQGNNWQEEQKLVPSDAASGDRAGSAVDLTDDVALIGSPGKASGTGAAYLFRRSGNSWSEEDKVTASDGAADDGFGEAVSLFGDLAVVGAAGHDGAATEGGAVYLFRNSGGNWAQEAKLTASDAATGDRFGTSVGVRGDRVIVGAAGAEAAYLFEHAGGGVWNEVAILTDAGAVSYGTSVGLSLDFASVGAPLTSFMGSAEVYCVNPGPVLTSISPTEGAFNQNTLVTLTGANFSAFKPQSVTFGGVAASSVTYVSENTVTCLSPTGTLGQTVDVAVTQDGLTSTLVGAFTYVGVSITDVQPPSGPPAGGNVVTITGTQFVDNGSTTVTFGGVAATVQSVTAPDTIVVLAPPGAAGAVVDVVVTNSNGSATATNAYTYGSLSIIGVDIAAGNLLGGQTLTVTVDLGTNVGDTAVTLGGVPMTVTSADATTVVFTTPGVPEPSGFALDLVVTNSNGSDTLTGAFTYTPSLSIGVTGGAATGGTLTIEWVTDPAAAGPQTIFLWVFDPFIPPLNATVFGYAGLIQTVPFLFLLQNFPANLGPLVWNYNPLPASVGGFPLKMEAVITGEGGSIGSFSNDATFVIPP